MYRWFLIFILAIINISNCSIVSRALCHAGKARYCRPTTSRHYGLPHNYYNGIKQDTPDDVNGPNNVSVEPVKPASTFEALALNLIAAETAIQNYCRENTDREVKEVYGEDNYILKYPMRGFKNKDVSVKIKHRVLYVSAEKPGMNNFKDLRILPNIVDTLQAAYVLENAILKVVIPYNAKYRKGSVASCEQVNDTTINVNKMGSSLGVMKLRTTKDEDLEIVKPVVDDVSVSDGATNDLQANPSLDEILYIIFESSTDSQIDIRTTDA